MAYIPDANQQIDIQVNIPVNFLPGWSYRLPLVVNANQVTGTLNYFPTLVSTTLNTSHVSFPTTWNDIVFTSDDGTSLLKWEIESYNSTTGELVAWVRLPTIANGTMFYVYYGNQYATNQEDATSVWDTTGTTGNYILVHHLNQVGTTVYDSTSNALDGTCTATVLPDVGKVGGCSHLTAFDTSRIDFHSSDLLQPLMNSWTVTLWIKTTDAAHGYVVTRYRGSGGNITSYDLAYSVTNARPFWRIDDQGDGVTPQERYRYWTTNIADGNWHYLMAQIDRTANVLKVFIDGVQQAGGGNNSLVGIGTINPTYNLYLGSAGSTNNMAYYDEFRIEKEVRTLEWYQACYRNMNIPTGTTGFLTVYPEEIPT